MPDIKPTCRRGARKPSPELWKRGRVYYARFSHGGRQIRKKLCSDLQTAEEMLAELKLATYRGEIGITTSDCLVADILDDYLKSNSQTVTQSSTIRYQHRVAHLKRILPAIKVSSLDVEHAEVYRAERLDEGVSAATINGEVSVLSAALSWAVDRKKTTKNPLARIRPLKHNRKESRPLTSEEIKALLDTAGEVWRGIWYAYLVTGLRKMELARLVWSDVDWTSRELIVRGSGAKNHKTRRIPIESGLMGIIANRHKSRSANHNFVFVSPRGKPITRNVYKTFVADCREAGIKMSTADADGTTLEAVTLHSTRHSFATHLIQSGQSPKTVQELLGHATLDLTMRIYSRAFPENKRAAIDHLPYGTGTAETPDVIRMGG